jgi:hypothetical protein
MLLAPRGNIGHLDDREAATERDLRRCTLDHRLNAILVEEMADVSEQYDVGGPRQLVRRQIGGHHSGA